MPACLGIIKQPWSGQDGIRQRTCQGVERQPRLGSRESRCGRAREGNKI
jgi:hypothetical protein